MTLPVSRDAAQEAAERLKVYAQPQRLMILWRLLQGEQTVGEIAASTGIGQPALSQQLAELRRAEVVKTRRLSKMIYYALADEDVRVCVHSIAAMFGSGTKVQKGLVAAFGNLKPDTQSPIRPTVAAAFAQVPRPRPT